MKTIELDVQSRQDTGKGANRRLRNTGLIPAVLYGASKKNFNLQTSTKTINLLVNSHNENAIITLKSSEKDVNGKHVLLKDWDRDVMTRGPLHVDFYEIDLKKAVRVKVPLHFVGKARGVTEGGLVSPIVREVEVDCLPTEIPEFFEIDVSPLGIGESLHIEDLTVPAGVTKHFTENYTLVTCAFIKEEVIATPDPTAAATLAEPEVMAKGKKDAEGEEGAAKAAPGGKAPAAAKAPAAKGGDKK